jgi:hypothetical protein
MSCPDTPDLSKPWCPVCQPELDPTREILQVAYCLFHPQEYGGSADGVVPPVTNYSWSHAGDMDPETNKLMNDLIRDGWSNR